MTNFSQEININDHRIPSCDFHQQNDKFNTTNYNINEGIKVSQTTIFRHNNCKLKKSIS